MWRTLTAGGLMSKAKCNRAEVVAGKSIFDNSYVSCDMNDGSKFKFDFYPDEINFTEGELAGKTREEIGNLRMKKDVAYLQS